MLVDEVLAVGDAAFRRRALEALRRLIAEGKTVLFISHDMWNVRRLCTDILWMEEGRVRAYGPAGEIAERYMNEVNLEALANQATALQSHRGGTGEVRYTLGRLVDDARRGRRRCCARATRWSSARRIDAEQRGRAAGVSGGDRRRRHRPRRHHGDVDRGGRARARWPATASIECRFTRLPLRPRQYVLRLSITDSHQLASYDVVTAGPRFAVTGHGRGVDGLAPSGVTTRKD